MPGCWINSLRWIVCVILAIELAYSKGCFNLWLEINSKLVTLAFNKATLVPRQIRNIWLNRLNLINNMHLIVSYIYREDNSCVDMLTTIGLSLSTFTCWDDIPYEIIRDFVKNRLGLPNYRFTTFWKGFGLVILLFFCEGSHPFLCYASLFFLSFFFSMNWVMLFESFLL